MDEERVGNSPDGEAAEETMPLAAATEEGTLRLKYNGDEMDLPMDEVVTLAQKGMNYDKIYARAQRADEAGAHSEALEKLAAASGMEPDEYLEALENERFEDILGCAVTGVPKEMEKAGAAEEAGGETSPGDDEALAGFIELVAKYPDLDALPEEAAALVRAGVPPLYAYEAAAGRQLAGENARLRAGLAAAGADARNRVTTPGSAESLGETADADPFLTGFQRGG